MRIKPRPSLSEAGQKMSEVGPEGRRVAGAENRWLVFEAKIWGSNSERGTGVDRGYLTRSLWPPFSGLRRLTGHALRPIDARETASKSTMGTRKPARPLASWPCDFLNRACVRRARSRSDGKSRLVLSEHFEAAATLLPGLSCPGHGFAPPGLRLRSFKLLNDM